MGLNVGVDDAVYNLPVVDGLAARVLGVGVGRSPLECGGSVARTEQMVCADINRDIAQSGQLAY